MTIATKDPSFGNGCAPPRSLRSIPVQNLPPLKANVLCELTLEKARVLATDRTI
ncbi:hypothetical protein [Pseudomonas sp. Kh13]|uniref:hypothetical protein n=1 Tax=Pseudomonas sp. Kh13 TaxID=2093744 RepID=UPI0015B4F216|nr:hypothetical protein [Pseudomonas sp. Kh13]